jgi:aldose 1-epimerase
MQQYQLTNHAGDRLMILSRGAIMQHWSTLVDGCRRELILGYQDPQQYVTDRCYLGALVGPYANRIGQGKVTIDQQQFQLQQNEGQHHLHGGELGLQRQDWTVVAYTPQQLVLQCTLADGHNGYPGPSHFQISYQLGEQRSLQGADGQPQQQCILSVEIQASCSRPTLIGPTLHPYFNLAADAISQHQAVDQNQAIDQNQALDQRQTIDQHQLRLQSAYYAVTDPQQIPTGELRKVSHNMDFNQHRVLGEQRLDHNFVVHGNLQQQTAELTSPDGLLKLGVSSDYPGLQVYTGDHLTGAFQPRQGICLEPQFFPDSPNQKCFPFQFTRPDQPFRAKICYWLTKS